MIMGILYLLHVYTYLQSGLNCANLFVLDIYETLFYGEHKD